MLAHLLRPLNEHIVAATKLVSTVGLRKLNVIWETCLILQNLLVHDADAKDANVSSAYLVVEAPVEYESTALALTPHSATPSSVAAAVEAVAAAVTV